MTAGLVYYALDPTRHAQYLKIGFTTGLVSRMAALKGITASGQVPIVLAVEAGDIPLERERHQRFADLRSHGEWFRYQDDLIKWVAEMEHPFAYLLDRPDLWRWAGGWGPLAATAGQQLPPPAPLPSPDGELDNLRSQDLELPPIEF